ncbi:MAG: molybdopterin-guanine dinucleotide biosynthesis protein A [Candidatus Frackibacter sp. T328-2]|nr:MAG: molybdopterin-guanine dinucleotide biosynthesis protein A [Candidatus Frackibacter sp. T328-2]
MAAIILAGGKSSRMKGANKPLMEFGEKTMIAHIVDKLNEIFSKVIIAAKDKELYNECRAKVVVDDFFTHQGPLSGMHAGLQASPDKYNLIIGCDMPLLSLELIEYMLNHSTSDILVPRVGNNFEPLHAIYSKDCLPSIEEVIKQNRYRIMEFWPKVDVQYIEEEKIREFSPNLHSFFNVNTREDYNHALRIVNESF